MPYRLLARLARVSLATVCRVFHRTLALLLCRLPSDEVAQLGYVDTTSIRLGRGARSVHYSGYKKQHALKYQCIVSARGVIVAVSTGYPASYHDYKIFKLEHRAQHLVGLRLIGDKAYVGLSALGVAAPVKRYYEKHVGRQALVEERNRQLSRQRIKIEHVFASLKRYQILRYAVYFTKPVLDRVFTVICRLHNLELQY